MIFSHIWALDQTRLEGRIQYSSESSGLFLSTIGVLYQRYLGRRTQCYSEFMKLLMDLFIDTSMEMSMDMPVDLVMSMSMDLFM